MKNCFYFLEKAPFILEIFNILLLFSFPLSRFKGSQQKRNFSKHVSQLKEIINQFQVFFLFYDLVHKWGLGSKKNIKLTFSWSLLNYLIFKSLFNALAVLGYLAKLRVMGLVFSADFLYTFPVKSFLSKYPIKLPSFSIWGEWPKGLRYYNQNQNVPNSNHTGIQLLIGCRTANIKPLPKGQLD